MVAEGCPLPVTPANSCDSEPADIPHTIDTIRMTVGSLFITYCPSDYMCKGLQKQ